MTAVAVVDYGTGNVHSIGRMLTGLGVAWIHTRDERALQAATHLVMPGVGHCAHAMRSLTQSGVDEVLGDLVLRGAKPILGICLGMQLMTARSEEGSTNCLGWFSVETRRITPENRRVFKVPNIGWHALQPVGGSRPLEGIDTSSSPFYFCHAYAVPSAGQQGVTATFDFDIPYAAVLERNNIWGVQFHPEKSQEAGLALMSNFLKLENRDV